MDKKQKERNIYQKILLVLIKPFKKSYQHLKKSFNILAELPFVVLFLFLFFLVFNKSTNIKKIKTFILIIIVIYNAC